MGSTPPDRPAQPERRDPSASRRRARPLRAPLPADLEVRRARRGDAVALVHALAAAAFWDRPQPPPVDEILATAELARYVIDWPRPGEHGLVAVDQIQRTVVGAAWWRCWEPPEVGYGFVAPNTPEIAVAVAAHLRGRGLGTTLVEALCQLADRTGVAALSLSVAEANPAKRIYQRLGFEPWVPPAPPASPPMPPASAAHPVGSGAIDARGDTQQAGDLPAESGGSVTLVRPAGHPRGTTTAARWARAQPPEAPDA